jgi:hypothetical protein
MSARRDQDIHSLSAGGLCFGVAEVQNRFRAGPGGHLHDPRLTAAVWPAQPSRRCAVNVMTTEADEHLALDYLDCRVIKRNGVIEFVYVEPGTDRETQCLAALDRLLRGGEPLSVMLRWKLASLFNPAKDAVEARQLR